MNKYIDADKLRAELEKRLKNVRDYMNGAGVKYKGPKYFKAQGKESAYDAQISIIASLQQEQSEADLEEEIDEYYHENLGFIISPIDTRIIVEHIAHHFYELGKKSLK